METLTNLYSQLENIEMTAANAKELAAPIVAQISEELEMLIGDIEAAQFIGDGAVEETKNGIKTLLDSMLLVQHLDAYETVLEAIK